jgi:hypothetical protein
LGKTKVTALAIFLFLKVEIMALPTCVGRAFRSNLFVPLAQKVFPLQSLTQKSIALVLMKSIEP